MEIELLLKDKLIKPKEKTEMISKMILDRKINLNELILIAQKAKESDRATCIEAIEFATKSNPSISTLECLEFVAGTLTEKAPRVKWESAKVIANIAPFFPNNLEIAIKNLLSNTESSGTVVRWSAALALGEIIKMKTAINQELIPAIESNCEQEEKNSIKKIYIAALKKAKN